MRTIDVLELGYKAMIVDCDDEQLVLVEATLGVEERAAVMRDVLDAI